MGFLNYILYPFVTLCAPYVPFYLLGLSHPSEQQVEYEASPLTIGVCQLVCFGSRRR
jgi:hypothetical protein